jgi:hypothetical protein
MATGGGSQGPFLVTVSQKQVEEVMDYVESDPLFFAAVNKINEGVFLGGVSVKINHFGKDQEIPDEAQKSFRTNYGNTGRRANLLGFAVGYSLQIPVPNPEEKGAYINNVVDPRDFDLHILYVSGLIVQYFITLHDRPLAGTVSVGELLEQTGQITALRTKKREGITEQIYTLQVQDNEVNRGWPLMGGGKSQLLYVRYPPNRRGNLQSPACFLRPERLNMRFMMQDQAYASYWMSHPLHVFNVTKDFRPGGSGGAGGATGREAQYAVGQFAQADTYGQKKEYAFQMREQEEASFKVAQTFARGQREYNSRTAGVLMSSMFGRTRPNIRSDGTNPNSVLSPCDSHSIIPPMNQQLDAPQVQAFGGVETVNQIVTEMAYSIMGIVPQVMNPTQTKFAADDRGVLRSWDEALQSIQAKLAPSLEEGFRAANYLASKRHVNGLYRDMMRLEDEQDEDDLEPVSRDRRKLIKQLRDTDQKESADQVIKQHKRSTKQQIQQRIQVTVTFNHIPRIDMASLQALYQLNFIAEDVFARFSTGLNGISPDNALLTQEQRDKEAERKRKLDMTGKEDDLKLQKKFAPLKPSAKPAAAKPAGFAAPGKK